MSNGEVWFLTGSQGLYGPETLDQVASQSREIAAQLDSKIDADVVWQPVLTSAEQILEICRRASSTPGVLGVITWMHTFSPAKMWIAGLDALRAPLLHLHTQHNVALPWSEIDMDLDRKSTRLNSSHVEISYAVFCLKKKTI